MNQPLTNPQNQLEEANITYLVVDDEITISESRKQNFINELNFPQAIAQFAGSYEEALNILNKNSDINLCFLDIKLPKTSQEVCDYEPQSSPDLGMSLIPKILELNNKISLIIFSAYVDRTELKQTADSFGILGHLRKDDKPEKYRNAFIQGLKLISSEQVILNEQQVNSDIPHTNINKKLSNFNYEQLDSKTQSFVLQKTELIKKLLKRTAQDIIDIGKYLTEVKQSLQHGQFYPWLDAEFNWTPRTATRFMRAYNKFKSEDLSDLISLPVSVIYELSTGDVSDETVQETLKLARAGKNVTIRDAKKIKSKQKPEKIRETNTSSLPDPGLSEQANPTANSLQNISEPLIEKTVDSHLAEDKNKDAQTTSSKQDIIKIIPRQNFWQLDRHTIFCADPNSTKFIEQLPSEIALCLAFPSSKHWQVQFDCYKSIMNYYSEYRDLDHLMLMESIDRIIQISTSEKDNIAICFIPHPSILSVIHQLGCVGYIVEPDYEKCLDLVEFFNQTIEVFK
jgi:CheY-like chemotaxis protein